MRIPIWELKITDLDFRMGLLVVGEPLNWEDTKKHAEYVRNAAQNKQTVYLPHTVARH